MLERCPLPDDHSIKGLLRLHVHVVLHNCELLRSPLVDFHRLLLGSAPTLPIHGGVDFESTFLVTRALFLLFLLFATLGRAFPLAFRSLALPSLLLSVFNSGYGFVSATSMLFLFEVKHVLKDAGSVPSILGMLANLGETIQGCFNALLDSGRLLARFQWLSHHGGSSRI